MEPVHNHFKPTFKLLKREKKDGKTVRSTKRNRRRPINDCWSSPDIPEATKAKPAGPTRALDPFALKKSIEDKLKKFFTALGNLDREATKT